MKSEESLDSWWQATSEASKESVVMLALIVSDRTPQEIVEVRHALATYHVKVVRRPKAAARSLGETALSHGAGVYLRSKMRPNNPRPLSEFSHCPVQGMDQLDAWWDALSFSEKETVYALTLFVDRAEVGEVVKIRNLPERIQVVVVGAGSG